MRERVEKMLNSAGTPRDSLLGVPEIGTFHSVCVRLLRREIERTLHEAVRDLRRFGSALADQIALWESSASRSVQSQGDAGGINRLKCDAVEPQEDGARGA